MQRIDDWDITSESKAAIRTVNDDFFAQKSNDALAAMVRVCRTTHWFNAEQRSALDQTIGAIENELASRKAQRTNRTLIWLTALTLIVASITLVATIAHW